MKNRLQFNRHYALFQSREEALNALRARITDPDFIPLIGEPIVFRYEDENGNVQLILAIGKKAGHNLDERDYHVIDTADLDEKIAAEVAAREELDAETIKRIIFDGVENTFENNVATLSVSANSIPIGAYEEYDGRANTPHPIHDDYSVLEAVKQVDTNFISFLNDTEAKVNGIHIVKVTSGLDANVREAYDLVNLSGYPQPNSERILIYKDSSLYNVYIGHTDDRLDDYSSPVVTPGTGDTALCFIYLKSDSTYQLVAIDVEDFLQENEFEDGFVVDNHVVKVKIDTTSEGFLTVGPDGVKLSGVQGAIDTARQTEEDRAVAVEEAIQAELDATQAGAGLAADGSYIHDHPTKYIDSATSLANADHLLDAALNELSSSTIIAVQNLQDSIDAERERATSAEDGLLRAINNEEGRAIAAENSLDNKISELSANTMAADQVLQDNINAEETRAIDAENALQAELDTTQAGAGLNADGTYHKHNTAGDMGNYIAVAESLDEATVMLDSAVADLSANTIAATASLDNKIDELSANTMAADEVLQNNIGAEETRARSAENTLQRNIDAEATRAQNAERTLQGNIDTESSRAQSSESVLNSKISALSAGTENEIARLDNKIDAETQRATTAENTINSRVDELSGATMAFSSATVSEIARIDAAASRNKVKSTGHTIVVTEAADGTNLEANIDGKTILSNNGELKTGLKVAALAPGELEANVREAFRLVDDRGIPVDNTIVKIYKSSSLVNVELVNVGGTDYVRITYINNEGETKTMDLNIQQLIFEAEFKDGLVVNDNGEVRVKIDPTSDPYLTVSSNGVKLSGIENTFKYLSAVTDNIISGCGLNIGEQGGYPHHDGTHFIKNAGSLDQADVLLDTAIWETSGLVADISNRVDALSGVVESFSSNTIEALSALSISVDERIESGLTIISGVVENYVEEKLSGITGDLIDKIENELCGLTEDLRELSGVVIDNELVVSEALNDLNSRIIDLSGYTGDMYIELDTRIRNLSGGSASQSDVLVLSSITINNIENINTLSSVTETVKNNLTVLSGSVVSLSASVVTNKTNIQNLSALTVTISGNVSNLSAATVTISGNVSNLSGAVINLSAATVTVSGNVSNLSGAVINLSAATVGLENNLDALSASVVTNRNDITTLSGDMLDKELVIAAALNDLNSRILELSGNSPDMSNYYTKNKVYNKEEVKQYVSAATQLKYTTSNALTNLTFSEFLTIATITANTTLSIASAGLPTLPANGVAQRHIIIENTGSSNVVVTIANDARVKITPNNANFNQFAIDAGGRGELNVLITYNGSAYTIYVITT